MNKHPDFYVKLYEVDIEIDNKILARIYTTLRYGEIMCGGRENPKCTDSSSMIRPNSRNVSEGFAHLLGCYGQNEFREISV